LIRAQWGAAQIEEHWKAMEDQELSQALKAKATYYVAPAALRAKVHSALNEAPGASTPARRHVSGFSPWAWLQANTSGWLGAGTAVAFGAVLAFGLTLSLGLRIGSGPQSFWGMQASATDAGLTNEIVAGHVRSLMASHLMDVASTDQHTVKPWFNGKVDFSPPVSDFTGQGYPLAGGRLDYLEHHAVAALVYRRHAHPINLFVWPEGGADEKPGAASEQGYHVMQWRNAGMRFAAVSDVNAEELSGFVDLVRQHASAP
jgi:anti-sigma factor RsiW